jgi:hypothetical protein
MDRRVQENIFSMGGGAYVSYDPYDSQEFGPKLAVFDPATDIRVAVYEHLMGSIESGIGVSRVVLNQALREAGLSGVRSVASGASSAGLHATWINLLTNEALTQMREGTFDDLARAAGIGAQTKREVVIAKLLDIDAKKMLDLAGSPMLQRLNPPLAQLLRGKALSPGQHDALWAMIRPALTVPDKLIPSRADQQLLPAIRREFSAEIDEELKRLVEKAGIDGPMSIDSLVRLGDPNGVNQYSVKKRFQLLRDLAAITAPPGSFANAVHPDAALHPKDSSRSALKDAFGQNLINAFAAGDAREIFAAIDARRSPPWDVPSLAGVHLDRWPDIARSGLRESADSLRAVHAVLTRPEIDPGSLMRARPFGSPLRGRRAVEEGVRVTEAEKQVLEANPFLAVKTAGDIASWEYPSAATWRKFAELLPEPLAKRLAAADPVPEDSDQFARLTQEILQALLDQCLRFSQFANIGSLEYQLLQALRPFDSANEAVIRAFVSRLSGPFLADRLDALTMTPDQFALEMAAGRNEHGWLEYGFARAEREAPSSPRFYDASELRDVSGALSDAARPRS